MVVVGGIDVEILIFRKMMGERTVCCMNLIVRD
jgi:hypothetical protein